MNESGRDPAVPPRSAVRLGVVVERRAARSRWADFVWRPHSVFIGAPSVQDWRELVSEGGRTRFHAATVDMEVHRAEAEDYKHNLSSPRPSIYVVLAPGDGPFPWRVKRVTASPYEAEAYMEGGEHIVGAVAMPEAVAAFLSEFAKVHFKPREFYKRRRDDAPAVVEERFGKQPVFRRGRGERPDG